MNMDKEEAKAMEKQLKIMFPDHWVHMEREGDFQVIIE
jgi:hypothetical protein